MGWRTPPTVRPGPLTRSAADELSRWIVDISRFFGGINGPGVSQNRAGVQINPPQRRVTAIAQATSTISAMSGSTPGSGTATIYANSNPGGALVSTGVSVTVYNEAPGPYENTSWLILVLDTGSNTWFAAQPGGGISGTVSRVVSVTCSGSTLTVTTQTDTYVNGLLISSA